MAMSWACIKELLGVIKVSLASCFLILLILIYITVQEELKSEVMEGDLNYFRKG